MDDTQLRFLTTRALYDRDLEKRNSAIRQLSQGSLTASNIAAIGIRLDLALNCQDEYVRSAAALLLAGLAGQIPTTPSLAAGLLALSRSAEAFPREAALRAIQRVCQHGRVIEAHTAQALGERIEEARRVEPESFALALFDEE